MRQVIAFAMSVMRRACQPGAVALTGTVLPMRVAAAGDPEPWQIGLQEAASPVMERIADLNLLLTVVIVAITTMVLALILFAVWRFRAPRNPLPSKVTHNTRLEVLWTVTPAAILTVIAVPSFRLLYDMDRPPEVDMTLEVTSHQWYWSYEYPDQGGLAFDSFIVPDEELKPGQPRLLTVDNPAVLPVDTTIRALVTSSDVLHGFAVPALGVKIDAVPGRINETWFRIERPGTYYGQCSELCGVGHAFMPIAVKAVSRDEFAAWVKGKLDKVAVRAAAQRLVGIARAADAD